jgi:sortase A
MRVTRSGHPVGSGAIRPCIAGMPSAEAIVEQGTAARALRLTLELAASLGAVILLLVAYLTWGRIGMVEAHQGALAAQLSHSWGGPTVARSDSPEPTASATTPPVPTDAGISEGAPIGRLYIPRLGLDWVVVQGIAANDIRWAPGHYPGTALPGVVGNFAVAGHREKGLFWNLDELRPGDYLIVQTSTDWYVYQVFQNHVVTPASVEVLAPTPNQPGVPPTQADITLTTCNPRWDNYQRMVVHGSLVQVTPAGQRPVQLYA